jgi:hypothetical protein
VITSRRKFLSSVRIWGQKSVIGRTCTDGQATSGIAPLVTKEGNPSMANAIRKRIALGAAVAVAAGMLTAVPASAAAPTGTTPFYVSAAQTSKDADGNAVAMNGSASVATGTATQWSGPSNFVGFTAGADVTLDTDEALVAQVTGSTIIANVGTVAGTLSTDKTTLTYANSDIKNAGTDSQFHVGTSANGTITVKFFIRTTTTSAGVVTVTDAATALQTFTITVSTYPNVYDAAKSKVVLGTGSTTRTYAQADVTVDPISATADLSTAVANVNVHQVNADGVALLAGRKAVSVSISGAGILGSTSATAQAYSLSVAAASAAAAEDFFVFADGRSGVGTITVMVDGTVLATKTVTFYAAAATIVATVKEPHLRAGDTTTAAITLKVTDANGVAHPGAVTATSGTTGTITNGGIVVTAGTATGSWNVAVTTVAAKTGTVTLTFKVGTATTTADVVVTKATAEGVTWAFDKTSYAPGEKATLTVTLKDADGVLLGAGNAAFQTFSSISTSSSITTTLGGSPAVSAGAFKYEFFMPVATGAFTVAGVLGTGVTGDLAGKTVSISTSIVAPVNADVVAAKAAADKAVAEVAKVQEQITLLASSVAALVASLSSQVRALAKQLTALSKAVAKIRR